MSEDETPRVARRGARVLFLDQHDRLLMVLGHDPHQPERSFWFTPGGGIEPGETAREAAVRELAEETGWVLEPHEVQGPVWIRTALFDFASEPYSQHEEYFVGRVADAERHERSDVVWTQTEIEAIDDVAWLSYEQLAAETREVFPRLLREPWSFLDWDGTTMDLGVEGE